MIPGLSGQPRLEAVWVGSGSRIAVVAPPHPLMGGELSNPPVQAVAQGLDEGGLRCLLFNWRGVGDSEGDPSGDTEDADADYRAAIAFAESAGAVVAAAGYSFGAATAIRVAASRSDFSVFALAPPAVLFPEGALAPPLGPILLVAGERDSIVPVESLRDVLPSSSNVKLETIPGADHFFMAQLESIRTLARRFGSDVLSR